MNKIRNSLSGIMICLFEIVVGLLLIVDPEGFAKGIIIAAGIVCIAVGLINTIKYFRSDIEEAAIGQYLMIGLVAFVGGIFCITGAAWIIEAVPALTIIYGVAILVSGFSKIQLMFDMIRRKNIKWFLALISAGVSILCSLLIIFNPFEATDVFWIFIGIALMGEAILDIVTMIFNKKGVTKKDIKEAKQVIDVDADNATEIAVKD